MIIFNTTYHAEDDVCEAFISFIKEFYVPEAMNSGFLHHARLSRIHSQHEESGCSYSLQFHVKNVDSLNHWLSTDGQKLQKEITSRFGNKALGFITLLEEIEL